MHPYTDPRVIAGQGTAALELLNQNGQRHSGPLDDGLLVDGLLVDGMLDALLVPVGGGGLTAGTAIAAAGDVEGVVQDPRVDLVGPRGRAGPQRPVELDQVELGAASAERLRCDVRIALAKARRARPGPAPVRGAAWGSRGS